MIKPKKLQGDFVTNITFIKNFGSARTCARGARQISCRCENLKIIVFSTRRQNILQVRAQKCARAKNFLKIENFIKFSIFYILLFFFISFKLMVLKSIEVLHFLFKKCSTAGNKKTPPLPNDFFPILPFLVLEWSLSTSKNAKK